MVNQLVNGSRPVPVEHCLAIERATNGLVTRRDLRPDDWQKIWPDLAEQAPAQPATEIIAIEAVVEEAKATLEDVAETMKVEIKHLTEEVLASVGRPSPPWDGITERRHPADTSTEQPNSALASINLLSPQHALKTGKVV